MIYTKNMSVKLEIDNYPSLNIKETTSLAVDVEPAATSLTLLNNNNIVADDSLLVGRRGSETAELRTVDSAAGATIVVTDALTLHHNAYEDVTALFGNKINIYRADNVNGTAPADSTFVLHDTIDIDTDQRSTIYTDPVDDDLNANYWYKYTYKNSTSSAETDLSQTVAVRGGSVGQYVTIDDIRSAAGFENNRNITAQYIDSFRRSAQDQINGKLAGVYTIPFTAPINGFITQIAKALAAGHIKLDQFGQNNKEGNSMIEWAEAQLEAIRSGEFTLTDAAGNTLPKPGGGGSGNGGMGFRGYPNDSEQEGGFKFHTDDRY